MRRKNVVGERRGKIMRQKIRREEAPSTAAASIRDWGMD
jgi:hypothetical protein